MLRNVAFIGVFAGLAIILCLVIWQGVDPIVDAFEALGIGIFLLLPVYLLYLIMGVVSWRLLFIPGHEPPFTVALNANWIGSSVNTLLPVSSIGGEAVKARLLALAGIEVAEASGSVVGDTTVQAISLALWGLIGVALLAAIGTDQNIISAAAGAAVLFCLSVAVFVLLQRRGLFGIIARMLRQHSQNCEDLSGRWASGLLAFDVHVREIYERPVRVVFSTGIRLASRIILTAEIWLAAWLIGSPITIFEAIMIRSLAGAIRGAAFFIPNGLGVQEGAYIVFGAVIGLPPDFSLSLSLAVRAREILSSIPGLIVWQGIEGQSLRRLLGNFGKRH